jgi:putative transposase
MPRRKDPRIPDAVLGQLLAGADPKTVFDPNGSALSFSRAAIWASVNRMPSCATWLPAP